MRFAQGKEAERIVRRGVRTLSVSEKRKLKLSLTNTYYVRQDLKRLTKRSVLVSSRQARQARERLGIERSVVAQRALGRAGRKSSIDALIKSNKDYREGKITIEQAKEQFDEVVNLSKVSERTFASLCNWRKTFEWYVRTLRDGNKQCVLIWESDHGFAVAGCVNHLIQIVESLFFFLISYNIEVVVRETWGSSIIVERDVALSEIDVVRKIVMSWKAGEEISEDDFRSIYLFKRLIRLLTSNYDQTAIIYTFVVRLTWRGEE